MPTFVTPVLRVGKSKYIHIYKVVPRDADIVADARAAISRSLQILRDSAPGTHLGTSYRTRVEPEEAGN
jgi:hypothetical protein